MKRFAYEVALMGALVVVGGCSKDDTDTVDTDTGDTNVEVPTEETDCADGDDEDEDGDEDCADSDCEGDDECVFVPYLVNASGVFAYDAAKDEVVSYTVGGQAVAPLIVLTFGTEELEETQDAERDLCEVYVTYTGAENLPLESIDYTAKDMPTRDARIVVLPSGDVAFESDCEDKGWDDSVFGTVEEVANANWGIGIIELNDFFVDAATQSKLEEGTYVGGGMVGDLTGGKFVELGVGLGSAIDEDYALLNENGEIHDGTQGEVPLYLEPSDIIETPQVLPTGAYTVASLYYAGPG